MKFDPTCDFCKQEGFDFKDRIIAETEKALIVATVGQITNGGYVLVIPKIHAPCIGAMKKTDLEDFQKVIEKVSEVLKKEYKAEQLFFEHGIVGQSVKHAHLHILPMPCQIMDIVKKDYPNKKCIPVRTLKKLQKNYARNKKPYIFFGRSEDDRAYICEGNDFPRQYLRTVAAKAYGHPERADWQKMHKAYDKLFIEETIRRLRPYFK